jgi:hypothetical protein
MKSREERVGVWGRFGSPGKGRRFDLREPNGTFDLLEDSRYRVVKYFMTKA